MPHLQTTQAQIVSFLPNIEATQTNCYCGDGAHIFPGDASAAPYPYGNRGR